MYFLWSGCLRKNSSNPSAVYSSCRAVLPACSSESPVALSFSMRPAMNLPTVMVFSMALATIALSKQVTPLMPPPPPL